VEAQVQTWLGSQRTAHGTPLSVVFQRELGMTPQDQARFLLYREMLRTAGPAIPAPSLTGTYLLLRGLGLLGRTVGGALAGTKTAGGTGGLGGLGTGAATGATRGQAMRSNAPWRARRLWWVLPLF